MKTILTILVLLFICLSCRTNNRHVPDTQKKNIKEIHTPLQTVNYKETSEQLDQVALWKKFSGTWKGEITKDTFIVYEQKPYGTGMENKIRIITGSKILQEGIGLFGYDSESDKIIEATLLKGADIISNAFWFTSENTCEGIPFKYISNPENADLRWKINFKTPDIWVVETIQDNNTIETNTLYRVIK